MAVKLPAFVSLQNTNLNRFLQIMRFFMFFLVIWLLLEKSYFVVIPMGPILSVNAWTSQLSPEELQEMSARASKHPYCASPQAYDYLEWPGWEYRVGGCIPVCDHTEHSEENKNTEQAEFCIEPEEMSFMVGRDELYVYTMIEEYPLEGSGTAWSPTGTNTSLYFLPGVEDMKMKFSWSYQVPYPLWETYRRSMGNIPQWAMGPAQIATRLTHSKDSSRFVDIPRNETEVSLTVAELFDWGGAQGVLDKQIEGKGTMAAGDTGPFARISGLEVVITIDCSNRWKVNDSPWSKLPLLNGEAHCELLIDVHEKTNVWPLMREVMYSDSGDVAYTKHAVHVRFNKNFGGVYRYDFYAFMTSIVNAMVFMRIPTQITLFVALYCIGRLSPIYRRVAQPLVDLNKEAAVLGTNLITHKLTYDRTVAAGEEGITRDRIVNAVQRIMEGTSLDESEQVELANYIFEMITEKFSWDNDDNAMTDIKSRVLDILDFNRRQRRSNKKRSATIDLKTYSNSLSSVHHVTVQDLAALFDSDRPMTCMERMFMPLGMQAAVSEAKRGVCDGGEIPERTDTPKYLPSSPLPKLRTQTSGWDTRISDQFSVVPDDSRISDQFSVVPNDTLPAAELRELAERVQRLEELLQHERVQRLEELLQPAAQLLKLESQCSDRVLDRLSDFDRRFADMEARQSVAELACELERRMAELDQRLTDLVTATHDQAERASSTESLDSMHVNWRSLEPRLEMLEAIFEDDMVFEPPSPGMSAATGRSSRGRSKKKRSKTPPEGHVEGKRDVSRPPQQARFFADETQAHSASEPPPPDPPQRLPSGR